LRFGKGGGFLAKMSAAAAFVFWLAEAEGPAKGKAAGEALPLALPGALPLPPDPLGFFRAAWFQILVHAGLASAFCKPEDRSKITVRSCYRDTAIPQDRCHGCDGATYLVEPCLSL